MALCAGEWIPFKIKISSSALYIPSSEFPLSYQFLPPPLPCRVSEPPYSSFRPSIQLFKMPHGHSNSMETKFGLPFFLEDKTGRLTGSDFNDLHDRMKLLYRPRSRDPSRGIYDIYDASSGRSDSYETPVVTLTFGSDNSLGTIKFAQDSRAREMGRYLSQVNTLGGSRLRRFFASDGNEYRWGWRLAEGDEWTCTNSKGEIISNYNLKSPGEPTYVHSSGCMLTVDESFRHLAVEMLATVMIMRHIAKYDL